MVQADIERLEELKLRIWACVARNLLSGRDDPYEVSSDEIESHGGRQTKAIRLLGFWIRYKGPSKSSHNSSAKCYTVSGFQDSSVSTKEPLFAVNLRARHHTIFKEEPSSQEEMNATGYRYLNVLKDPEVLDVYWHKEEYSIINIVSQTNSQVFPKRLLEESIKATFVAIIDHYIDDTFHSKIEEYLSIPANTLKTDNYTFINPRNFSAHGCMFSEKTYLGKGGFLEEYTHYMEYYQALIKSLNTFNDAVQKMGGYKAIIKNLRKDTIEHFLHQAPLHAFTPYKEDETPKYQQNKKERIYINPFVSTFILQQSEYFSYEALFTDDQPLLITSEEGYGGHPEKPFVADEQELKFIQAMKG